MMDMKASVMGSKAKAILDLDPAIKIKGVTSRGTFLEANGEWILFLTGEKFRGPLTLNVPGFDRQRRSLSGNQPMGLLNQTMRSTDSSLAISFAGAEIWQPEPLIGLSGDVRAEAIQKAGTINDPLIRAVLGLEETGSLSDNVLLSSIMRMSDFVQKGDFSKASLEADWILGRGEGLTPEGDDYVIGLLYSLRVGINSQKFSAILDHFFGKINKLAVERTTMLSENLISCASEGLADERISEVVKALYQESSAVGEKVDDLLKWGNTSGRMALVGIVCGIMANY